MIHTEIKSGPGREGAGAWAWVRSKFRRRQRETEMAAVTRALTGSESPLSGALPALPPAPAAREERERGAAAAQCQISPGHETHGGAGTSQSEGATRDTAQGS